MVPLSLSSSSSYCCSPHISNPLPSSSRNPSIPTSSISTPNLRARSAPRGRLLLRAATSEETSNGANQYAGEDRVITVQEVPPVEQKSYVENFSPPVQEEPPTDEENQPFQLLDNIKFDSEDYLSIVLYGSGALIALYLASAVVGAIDSIPVFPKIMEVVGLLYSLWFSYRYLIFKKNREEFFVKLGELKEEVLGSDD